MRAAVDNTHYMPTPRYSRRMANEGDPLKGALASAISRIYDQRYLAVLVMVIALVVYSGVTNSGTAFAVAVIAGVTAIVVLSISDALSGVRMSVFLEFPQGRRASDIRIEKCDYEVFGPADPTARDRGTL